MRHSSVHFKLQMQLLGLAGSFKNLFHPWTEAKCVALHVSSPNILVHHSFSPSLNVHKNRHARVCLDGMLDVNHHKSPGKKKKPQKTMWETHARMKRRWLWCIYGTQLWNDDDGDDRRRRRRLCAQWKNEKRCGCLFRTGSWISERLENICVIININKARVCFLHCDGAPFMNDGREFLLSKHLHNWLLNKWITHKSADFPSKWS